MDILLQEEVIGIDLGGTAIKMGRFNEQGNCLQSLTIPTPQPAYPKIVLETLVRAIARLDSNNQSVTIGVGTPGIIDATGRIAKVAINLEGWRDIPLANWLETEMGRPTILANDANCAGMGEYWLGAGKSFQNMIMLTLGTGVGGAIILDGKLYVGHNGMAGELGLMTLNLKGPPCNSGNSGSLEQYVSIQAIRRETGLEPHELGEKAEAGDEGALSFWQTYGSNLGTGITNILYAFDPEAVIIGGGVSLSAKFFFPSLQAEVKKRFLPSLQPESRPKPQFRLAELGNQAGMVGAAKLAWDRRLTK